MITVKATRELCLVFIQQLPHSHFQTVFQTVQPIAMTVVASIIYPIDAKFDMNYYLKVHMPLVQEKWSPFGLQKYEIVSLSHGLNGLDIDTTKTPYGTHAILHWESQDGFANAVKSEPESKIFADVPNFSDKAPICICGNLVGTS